MKTFVRPKLNAKISIVVFAIITNIFVFPIVVATEDKITTDKPQAIPVDITIIKEQAIRHWKNFSGHLTAVDYVEIRPQVTGLITDIRFEDGQLVAKGDILYVIDPRTHQATVAKAKADLIVARNRFTLANKEYKRSKGLIKTKVISQRIFDERLNEKLVAESTVKSAEAQLLEAEINLSHAYITAPVSGRVSRAEITEGNLVAAGSSAPLLTTIVSSSSIYADFDVDEQTYLHYLKTLSSNIIAYNKFPVELRLQDGSVVYYGHIHAFDNRIDPNTGTIRARAIFNNPQAKLLPGMYASLRIGSPTEEKTILISERAIGTDQNRKFVYIVNNQNKTIYKEVHLGDSIDGARIVHSGLESGDRVIIRGLIRIRPDMLVTPMVFSSPQIRAEKS